MNDLMADLWEQARAIPSPEALHVTPAEAVEVFRRARPLGERRMAQEIIREEFGGDREPRLYGIPLRLKT